jgi:hypothetical protein
MCLKKKKFINVFFFIFGCLIIGLSLGISISWMISHFTKINIVSLFGPIIAAFLGALAGFGGALYLDHKRREKEKEEKRQKLKSILELLMIEILEGFHRCWGWLAETATIYSRIYVQLWESVRVFIFENINNKQIIKCLHKVYYSFDLINFNQEQYGKVGFESGKGHAQNALGSISSNFKEYFKLICKEFDIKNFDIILEKLEELKGDMDKKHEGSELDNKNWVKDWMLKKIPGEKYEYLRTGVDNSYKAIEDLIEFINEKKKRQNP